MTRALIIFAIGLVAFGAFNVVPVTAATNAQKMETCKFGADDQKLEGAKRKAFMAKCMSKKDDPRGTPEKK
ncbi:MAG: hypothetical protein JO205_13585 [Pseudolabrys sp.]|nr:hypothetical protein [Pseudolabrys sp.]MBV9262392.1 hypothetical protein [Pseudolabrys sp.]